MLDVLESMAGVKTKVVIITGHESGDVINKYDNVIAILTKPFSIKDVSALVEQVEKAN